MLYDEFIVTDLLGVVPAHHYSYGNHNFVHTHRLATIHNVTDRQTDDRRRTQACRTIALLFSRPYLVRSAKKYDGI